MKKENKVVKKPKKEELEIEVSEEVEINLETEIEELREENKELKNDYLKAYADTENFKKRM